MNTFPLLTLQSIRLTFGGKPLFSDLSLSLKSGDHICLVGKNGCGKSTLLKLLSGDIEPDYGTYFLKPGTTLQRLSQDPVFPPDENVRSYLEKGLFADPSPFQDTTDKTYLVDMALAEIAMTGDESLERLSGGEGRRVAIVKTFLQNPDILLLDEPTNHLDLPTITWLEKRLKAFKGALVLISHDRTFLTQSTGLTWWLDQGRIRCLEKDFSHFEAWSDQIIQEELTKTRKIDNLIDKETQWSREGISARRKRNQGRLKALYKLREKRASIVKRDRTTKLEANLGEASGRLVAKVRNIHKSYEGKTIIADFSMNILRGDKIGIIGPNGAGKSTLIKLLTRDLNPDQGKVTLGTNLTPIYFDQKRATLNPEQTLWEFLCDGAADQVMVHGKPRHVMGYLRDFLFEDCQARSPIQSLSGGEKNRLLLAKFFAKSSNFMILDEPTNDLDMDTLDLLQDLLNAYEGTLLLVSHDRDFLDKTVTSTLVFEGEGKITEYPGGYSDYIRQRKAEEIEKSKPKVSKKNASPSLKKTSKLSFNLQYKLEKLPQEIEKLTGKIETLEKKLMDDSLYQRDPGLFDELAQTLEEAKSEKESLENEWLEIEIKREMLEND